MGRHEGNLEGDIHVCRDLRYPRRGISKGISPSIFPSCLPILSRFSLMSAHLVEIFDIPFDIPRLSRFPSCLPIFSSSLSASHVLLMSFEILPMSLNISYLSRSFPCLPIFSSSLSTSHVFRDSSQVVGHLGNKSCLSISILERLFLLFPFHIISSFHIIMTSLHISSNHVFLSYIGWLQSVGSIQL